MVSRRLFFQSSAAPAVTQASGDCAPWVVNSPSVTDAEIRLAKADVTARQAPRGSTFVETVT
jgi:hypothetical protein